MLRYSKIIIPVFILISIIAYSLYLKKDLEQKTSSGEVFSGAVVMQELPKLNVFNLEGKIVASDSFLRANKAVYVHIWGTWCGPCESEFGDILKFAETFQNLSVSFYLIAVNDDVNNVKKFLKRYAKLPTNVYVLIDSNNQVMDRFNTFKVPETFLFNGAGKTMNKYIGPQEWLKPIYKTQLESIVN